jgi:hypothetical protein
MHPVNILRIFVFSLVLGHSNSNNTLLARNHGQSAVLIVGAETVPTRARDIRATSNLL